MTNTDPRSSNPGQPPHEWAQAQHEPQNQSPYPAGYPAQYPPAYSAQYPPPYPAQYSPPYPAQPFPPSRPTAGRRAARAVGVLAVAAALAVSGFAIGRSADGRGLFDDQAVAGSGSSGSGSSGSGSSNSGGSASGPGYIPTRPGSGSGGGTGSGSGSGSSAQTSATSTQQAGIVTIVSTLGYQSAKSAGTGMVLSADGKILTNNHVISGATSITVTVETTDKSYKATVVGTDPSDDVAVLKLQDASGLATANVGDDQDVSGLQVGDSVTGVGNSNGGGTLLAAAGKVTALEKSITAGEEGSGDTEQLSGLIETDAPIVSGDSGGPLYDSDGDIVGIDTAASSTNGTGAAAQAYAIPIDDALEIVAQIDAGTETSSVHIGLPAFIGVGVADTSGNGAGITSVLRGGPAAKAGITQGSTITSVGGKAVRNAAQLKTRLAAYEPGQKVVIAWSDSTGQRRSATLTLATGPAD